jgi:hypothetical protein
MANQKLFICAVVMKEPNGDLTVLTSTKIAENAEQALVEIEESLRQQAPEVASMEVIHRDVKEASREQVETIARKVLGWDGPSE